MAAAPLSGQGPAWLLRVPLLLLALAAQPAAAQAMLSATAVEPRAFGYSVGDVLQRRVLLHLPAGMALDTASLPPLRRPGQALELRSARLHGSELVLDYQVFFAPTEVRTLEAPPLRLRFAGPGGEQTLRVDAWPVTVAPLVPVDVSPRRGLGEMQPDVPPPAIDTTARQLRLAIVAGALALLALFLLHLHVGLPWLARRRRPFRQALRSLKALPPQPAADRRRAAMRLLHGALNRSAGHVLFAADVPAFVAVHPQFAPVQDALHSFFRRSQDEFFGGGSDDTELGWLQQLARDCRDAERGGA